MVPTTFNEDGTLDLVQDVPVAGTPLPAARLARMARKIDQVAYFEIETAGAAALFDLAQRPDPLVLRSDR